MELARLRLRGAYAIVAGALLLLVAPLYQSLALGPSYTAAVTPIAQSRNFTPYLTWLVAEPGGGSDLAHSSDAPASAGAYPAQRAQRLALASAAPPPPCRIDRRMGRIRRVRRRWADRIHRQRTGRHHLSARADSDQLAPPSPRHSPRNMPCNRYSRAVSAASCWPYSLPR